MVANKHLSLEYVAGFFDGEGSVSIIRKGQRKDGKLFYGLVIQLTSSSTISVSKLQKQFGGGLYKESHKDRRRVYYKWMIEGKKAQSFLEQILPYLQMKNRQAEIGITYQQTVLPSIGSRGKRTDETYEMQTKLREALMELNKRL